MYIATVDGATAAAHRQRIHGGHIDVAAHGRQLEPSSVQPAARVELVETRSAELVLYSVASGRLTLAGCAS